MFGFSPLYLGVLETARVLLRIEAVTARLESWDIGSFNGTANTGSVWGLVGRGGSVGEGGSADEGVDGREADEEEMAELLWKIARLMELFLSNEMQVHTCGR